MSASPTTKLPVFSMRFEPMTIEHLGLRLYSRLPPVINEFVTNGYDAESPKVEVIVPTGQVDTTSEVIVRDFGHGLTPEEIQNEFLPIGRNRRGTDSKSTKSKNGLRVVTGRKGLGKLSALGIANQMQVRSVHDGLAVCLRLRYDAMKEWALNHAPGQPYEPEVVMARSGPSTDPNGVEIVLTELHRTTPVDPVEIRRGIARRIRLIAPGFQVVVNGTPIGPGDRVQRADCALSWELSATPIGDTLPSGDKVSGWIGFLSSSSGANRGVDIFATNKAVELGSLFNYSSPHAIFARAYLAGEVHADCLDSVAQDLASTARASVVWESLAGQHLQAWGQRLLQWAFEQWVEDRKKTRAATMVTAGRFGEWLATRPRTEQKVAERLIKVIAANEDLEPAGIEPLVEIVKASVETIAFRELVEALDEDGITVPNLLKLFSDWKIIEAREHLRLADGRVSVIDKLNQFIQTGALEVTELQPLLVENLWLLDQTWSQAWVQPTYTKLLRDKFKQPKKTVEVDKRLDIVGVADGGRLTVVELKRPEKTLSRDDLNQLEGYVDWARAHIGSATGQDAFTTVEGLLLVGKMGSDAAAHGKVTRMASAGMRVQTFREIHSRAGEYFREFEKRLKEVAPEYARSTRKTSNSTAGTAKPPSGRTTAKAKTKTKPSLRRPRGKGRR